MFTTIAFIKTLVSIPYICGINKSLRMTLILKEVLADKNISIEELKNSIESLGESLSRTSISKIVNGKTSPRVSTLQNIANAIGVDIRDLFDSDIKGLTARDKINNIRELLNELDKEL